ncbi:MAG TPA: hypothetical protein VJ742_02590 [Nitrososphaera sp.]|nr:hypothetical protein [Nitrososphaera sp.]
MSHLRVILAFDLSGAVTFVTSQTVMYAGLAFFAGMAGVILYHRFAALAGRRHKSDDSITEAVVMEYSRRLREYDKAIAELRTKLDIMELKAEMPKINVISQDVTSRAPQPHVARITEPPVVTEHITSQAEAKQDGQNGTTDYILKMLAERPRTSREVQQAIGRTREHTARLMKRLTESQFVERDGIKKPFHYTVTDLGRERLREKTEAASELRNL